MMDRRLFLAASAATAAMASTGFAPEALAASDLKLGPAVDFSFEALKTRVRAMAAQPYRPAPSPDPAVLNQIDYDAHGKIKFNPDYALFADGPGQFPVTFFHLGQWFQKPVRMRVVADGKAREIVYEPRYFDMPADSPAKRLKENAGFAGFRFQESRLGDQAVKPWRTNDWVAFLGASYFRAIGELYQYGLSARGIAINVTVAEAPEEFPDFTEIYFETPKDNGPSVTVYALLEGPSVVGAYKFIMTRDTAVVMDIEAALTVRKPVFRFGLAPLTSMFWFSETVKQTAVDWRPEVHDSDGLAMWTGSGERIWRPLNNPPRISASAFQDVDPRGFGLMQRDRNGDHFQDGVFYEKRPSAWVEPVGKWGKGSVQLIEIPTDDEIHDNTVAMWVPAEPAIAGQSHALRYRIHWVDGEPFPSTLARCVATRLGNGGVPGQPRPKGVRKFMIEFLGGPLKDLPFGAKPEVVLSASRGTFSYVFTEAVPNNVPGHWRAQFDLAVSGTEPVDIRCYLKLGDQVLSETWLYQYLPF
ncbi:glucan biosynthesis protein [Chelatococcus reniformis]|uniref:Glucan biosynthesis protein D n=1 Tax=Chelatococcus reniformis TaxID=1494448 RepID=A0A916XCK0_9HYPH|nr:glucan biosynthesis protein D [Chelatococcus reniformis]GGC63569.1 glucan biosynthesis protein D [Chelatococcus reniformis]